MIHDESAPTGTGTKLPALEPDFFNEVFEKDGRVRTHYGPLMGAIGSLNEGELAARISRANGRLREEGATFVLPDDPDNSGRIFPVDWIPRIIPPEHWQTLQAGLSQRGRAINAWLREVYGGKQDVVPDEVLRDSVFYRPHAFPGEHPVHVYGPDVVHVKPGEYVVLEDNARVPSGIAYSDVIRRVGMEVLPELFEGYGVAGIFAYYSRLRATLLAAAPPDVDEPHVAVVTRGERDSAFFEHERIARSCGVPLLTLSDCFVKGGEVRTRPEGRRLDAMYRRFDEDYVDTDLPEMKNVYLNGKIGFANSFGAGVADDKAVFPFVPAMVERYLGEKPVLQNAPTYSLIEEDGRTEVLDRLPELVLKPREGYGAQGMLVGPEASREDLEEAVRRVKKDPTAFVAQEFLDFSTHITHDGENEPDEAFVDLRAFVLPALDHVMPGGLTRVARPGTRVVNSSAGGSSKDTWVLE
ncbi:circularly permuted type 2 ATP-grasp protein [Rubrobacter tropicus]|uniref:Circularly permuted type 2 ATP-grasp protein n=1 Tax=Rubrobacter tropicus TaxID=2653851 RepID=A0A6G8Q873_9ACTN|nr:circularly permuted type 2 ATP-grasp protein [Rubrobacter tropicus]QIN82649.1 circularly permuted type 2 ATP-grasp protein [Rubrobacter tropicus]